MDKGTKRLISKDSQQMYEVTSANDPDYSRKWKKAVLIHYCKRVYGIPFSEWKDVHKGRYKGWILKSYKEPNLRK